MSADPRIDTTLAGYHIEALLGRGGMGVVYRAEQARLGRKVALKVLSPELAANEGFRVRFEHESRLAAAIDHPNIIPLYEAGEADGLLFITMRYVEGTDLKALVAREGPMDLRRAVAVVAQLASALDAAHARGLVHRDVKPANVLVSSGAGPESSDHCYLTDFGLTKDTSASVELTATGQFVGTIDYVSPEQIQGSSADGRADLYSLACVFYECLTGRPPYQRETDIAVMWAHLQDQPPRLSEQRPDLPVGLDLVLAKAMSKSPEDRYPTCAAFVAAARAELDAGPPSVPAPPAGAAALTRPPTPPAGAPAIPAGATRPAGTPAIPAGETRLAAGPAAPAAAPAAPVRTRSSVPMVLAAVLLIAAAAAGGVLVGGRAEETTGAGPVRAAGPLRLQLPGDWAATRPPGQVEGLEITAPLRAGPPELDGRAGLEAGLVADPGPALVPLRLSERLAASGTAPAAVALGDARALVYRDLPLAGAPGRATLYVIPTSLGPVAVTCAAAPDANRFVAQCHEALGGLRLTGAEALDPLPSPDYAGALDRELAAFAGARDSGRRRLRQARSRPQQLAAMRLLARSLDRQARRLEGLRPPAVARQAHRGIARAARDEAAAYRAAAAAMSSQDARGYRAAGRAAGSAQERLARAATALAPLGYQLG